MWSYEGKELTKKVDDIHDYINNLNDWKDIRKLIESH